MRQHLALLIALAICLSGPAFAQSKHKPKPVKKTIQKQEETIVIKKDGNNPQTVIEIKNGNVYVNGEYVAKSGTGTNVHKKIIIDNDIDVPVPPNADMPGTNAYSDAPSEERKAILGVYTEKNRDESGAEVQRVMPNSGADKAGLQEGDIITKINGREIADPKELSEVIANHEAGDKVTITYMRDGKTNETEAMLKEAMPELTTHNYRYRNPYDMNDIPNPMHPFFNINDDPFATTPKLGIEAEELRDGVRVANIKPGSPAEKAGLEKGDVITKIDNERIYSVDDIREAIRNRDDRTIKLHYKHNGEKATTEVTFPKQTRREDL